MFPHAIDAKCVEVDSEPTSSKSWKTRLVFAAGAVIAGVIVYALLPSGTDEQTEES